MKIKRLYIGDMGIYRNALMEDIAPNIVLIGGLNRAGKTTLLEVLRHLPYGFPKNLRDTTIEYSVEADLIDDNGEGVAVKISGLKEPLAVAADGKNIDYKSLYGDVDKFTYSKLYTITLDELRKSNIKEEEEKIKAVLMGAGLSDVAIIPKIVEGFRKEKEKIGGKNGSPTTKLFKAPYDKLLSGIEERDQALRQVEEYKEKCQQADSIDENIKELTEVLHKTENSLKLMEAVKANFNYYEEQKLLNAELEKYASDDRYLKFETYPAIDKIKIYSEEYVEAYNEYEEAKNLLNRSVDTPASYNRLIDDKDRLQSFEKASSGLKQKIENYLSQKKQYERDKEALTLRINDLNLDFKGDFLSILDINCDFIEEQRLLKLIEAINEKEENQKRIRWEEEGLAAEKNRVINEMNNSGSGSLVQGIRNYLFISLAIFSVGMLLFIYNKTLGGALALAGTGAAFIYAFIKNTAVNEQAARQKTLKTDLNSLESKIKSCAERIASVQGELQKLQSDLEVYKKNLKLSRQVSPSAFYEYYKNLKQLKSDVVKLGYSGKNLDGISREIKSELQEIRGLLQDILGSDIIGEENLLKDSEMLFKLLEAVLDSLDKAEVLSDAEQRLESTRGKVSSLLKIDCLQDDMINELNMLIKDYESYNEYKTKESRLNILSNIINGSMNLFEKREMDNTETYDYLFSKYSSLEDITRSCLNVEAERKSILDKLEELKGKHQKLMIEIDNLSTSDKLQNAQRLMSSSRGELENLAVKYSVYSAAEYILDKVQKKFIEDAKDTLLSGAGKIFNIITSGEYHGIIPGENLLYSDFRIIDDAKTEVSTDILSRGTGEQLFLSVRLNRIKESSPKLPVVLDDAFVNFDNLHTRNTLAILSEISNTNQVFIFTCHPEVVSLVSEASEKVQYWKLKKGTFELSNTEELIDYLSKKGR